MAAVVELAIPLEVVALSEERNLDLSRWLTELAVLDAYREGRISAGKVGEILGLNLSETEGWLKLRESLKPSSIDLVYGPAGTYKKHSASGYGAAAMGRSGPIPVTIPSAGRQMPAMSNADLFEAIKSDC